MKDYEPAQGLLAQGFFEPAQGLPAQGFFELAQGFPAQTLTPGTMVVEPLTDEALELLGNKATKLVDNREAAAIVVMYCNFMIFVF